MKKYTRKKGSKPSLSEAEIAQLRNFDALKTNYQRAVHDIHRKPVYKNPKFFFGLLMIILIAYILFEIADKEKVESTPQNTQQTK